ncbi:cation:dicarboxylase symporter family transporter [Caulobacter sp. 73W]|uniref:Cation:dicarboxylase symporter family transporter n=1 Tax=Caulobacter sp. 73W TaxID=3161137 RepID=A0AB39KXD3_9CAUL
MSTRLLAGLIAGILTGAALARLDTPVAATVLAVGASVGQIWLDALTMTVVPLVFGLLVTGIASAGASGAQGAIAARAAVWFAVLLVGACALSALTAWLFMTAWPLGPGASGLIGQVTAPMPAPSAGDAPWYRGLIPANPVKAAAEMAMAPLVIFGLIFGLAADRIEASLRDLLVRFFQAVVASMLVIVRWVLLIGPLGVFGLALSVGASFGAGVAGALVSYVATVCMACLAVSLAAYVVLPLATRTSPMRLVRAALPVQALALGTQSSLACLPAMVNAVPQLGAGPGAGVVLPLAVSIFRMSSAAANIAVAVWLAHLHGVAIAPGMVAIGVLIAAPVSLAAVGLPAQVNFFATIAPVCLAMGVPIQVLPILLAVETLPDIMRTLGNVTWHMAVTRLAGGEARQTP